MLSTWWNFSSKKVDLTFYWLNGLVFSLFFSLLFTSFNVLGITSVILLVLTVMYFLIQPGRIRVIREKHLFWLLLASFSYVSVNISINSLRGELSAFNYSLMFAIAVMPFITFYLVNTRWSKYLLITSIFIGAAIGGYIAIDSLMAGKSRYWGGAFNPIYWGMFGVMYMGFSLYLSSIFIRNKRFFIVILSLAAAAAGFGIVLASGSKGAIIALLIVVPLLPILMMKNKLKAVAILFTIAIFMVVSSVVVFKVFPDNKFVKRTDEAVVSIKNYQQGKVTGGSTSLRIQFYETSYEAFKLSPIYGNSIEDIEALKNQLIEENRVTRITKSYNHMHSDIIHAAAMKGILGVVVYLLLMATILILLTQYIKDKHISHLAILAMTTFISIGFFDTLMVSGKGNMTLLVISVAFFAFVDVRRSNKAEMA